MALGGKKLHEVMMLLGDMPYHLNNFTSVWTVEMLSCLDGILRCYIDISFGIVYALMLICIIVKQTRCVQYYELRLVYLGM